MEKAQLQISRFAQGREFSRTAFEIIDQLQCMQAPPTTSPESAAKRVNELYLDYEMESQGDEQQKADDSGTFLYEYWDLVFNIAGQLPHDSTEQDTLAEFIGQLQQIDTSRQFNGAKLWKELPCMTLAAREAMNDFHQKTIAKRNFLSFVARLTGKELCDFSLWAIWEFRDVLEDESNPRSREYQTQGS